MCYSVDMRSHLGRKRKLPIADGKPTHVRVSQRGKERLEECFAQSGFKTRQQMLDNLIRDFAIERGVERQLERRWRNAGKRKKATKARKPRRREIAAPSILTGR